MVFDKLQTKQAIERLNRLKQKSTNTTEIANLENQIGMLSEVLYQDSFAARERENWDGKPSVSIDDKLQQVRDDLATASKLIHEARLLLSRD